MRTIFEKFIQKLSNIYEPSEARSLTKYVWAEILKVKARPEVYAPDIAQTDRLESILDRLLNSEPIQYILGYEYFFDLILEVNQQVLIPRPETEELVDWILKEYKYRSPKILDIGTGSGCIACSLKKHLPKAQLTAIDLSETALNIAQRNAQKYKLDILFEQIDILTADLVEMPLFDIIVSNPPYITEQEKISMHPNVVNYEPKIALFVPNDNPILFYERIAILGKKKLDSSGTIYLEISEFQVEAVRQIFLDMGYTNIEFKKDMQQKWRMAKIIF